MRNFYNEKFGSQIAKLKNKSFLIGLINLALSSGLIC